jgi:hypothetical protein
MEAPVELRNLMGMKTPKFAYYREMHTKGLMPFSCSIGKFEKDLKKMV